MILSVETVSVSERFGDERAFELIKEAGFDGVDYSFYWCKNRENPLLFDNYRERAAVLRKKLDELGLVCYQAHAPFSLKYDTPKDDPQWIELERSLEFASILGVKTIIVHSFAIPIEKRYDIDFVKFNLDFYKSLQPLCERFGIKIGVENLFIKDKQHKRILSRLGYPYEMNYFMAQLDPKYFTVCVDIGHAALTDDAADYIRRVKHGSIGALHVQDNDYLDDRHILPFMGVQNWEDIISALAESGYDGDFTLEVFKFLRAYPDAMVPNTLRFACETGRYLIGRLEEKRAELGSVETL